MISRTLRTNLFRIHKWLGLNLAIFFGVMFLSGAILVVSDEINALMHPKTWAGPVPAGQEASFGTIYDSVMDAYPGGTIFVQRKKPQTWLADRTFLTTAQGEKIAVWSDPRTAQVVDETSAVNFRTIIRGLHDSLLVPGRLPFIMVSATSLILLSSVVSGLITYRRFWKGLLRLPSRQSGERGFQGGLHRLIAVWVSLFLLLISLTGAFFLTTGLGMNGFTPKPQAAIERLSMRPDGFDGSVIDAAEKIARTTLKGFVPATLVAPRSKNDGIIFSGFTDKHGTLNGPSTVAIDPTTMEVLGIIRPTDARGNARLKPLMDAIHFGHWGGDASRVLWVVLGIASFYLMLSGVKVMLSRTAIVDTASNTGWRRFLSALGLFRWLYMLVILGVVAIGLLRYGPF